MKQLNGRNSYIDRIRIFLFALLLCAAYPVYAGFHPDTPPHSLSGNPASRMLQAACIQSVNIASHDLTKSQINSMACCNDSNTCNCHRDCCKNSPHPVPACLVSDEDVSLTSSGDPLLIPHPNEFSPGNIHHSILHPPIIWYLGSPGSLQQTESWPVS